MIMVFQVALWNSSHRPCLCHLSSSNQWCQYLSLIILRCQYLIHWKATSNKCEVATSPANLSSEMAILYDETDIVRIFIPIHIWSLPPFSLCHQQRLYPILSIPIEIEERERERCKWSWNIVINWHEANLHNSAWGAYQLGQKVSNAQTILTKNPAKLEVNRYKQSRKEEKGFDCWLERGQTSGIIQFKVAMPGHLHVRCKSELFSPLKRRRIKASSSQAKMPLTHHSSLSLSLCD